MRSTLVLALLLTSPTLLADGVKHPFDTSVARGKVQRVIINIPAGDITIRNGAADRLAVSGVVSRDPDSSRSRPREQRIVDDTSVEISINGDEANIWRKFGPEAKGWRAEMFTNVDVDIELPPGVDVDVKTRFGDVKIDGSFGSLDVDLTAGEVDVRLPRSDVRELRASCRVGEVRTNVGGEITTREGLFPGETRYQNPSGKAFVSVHTTFGEVRVRLTP